MGTRSEKVKIKVKNGTNSAQATSSPSFIAPHWLSAEHVVPIARERGKNDWKIMKSVKKSIKRCFDRNLNQKIAFRDGNRPYKSNFAPFRFTVSISILLKIYHIPSERVPRALSKPVFISARMNFLHLFRPEISPILTLQSSLN